ncbi:MAG: 2OG-Fe(II) oxygenase [Minicystis sp.]
MSDPHAHEPPVQVTLLLAGGHAAAVMLSRRDPLWNLIAAALAGDAPPGVARVTLADGAREIIFRPRDLVGIFTEPPFSPTFPAASPDGVARFTDFLPHDEHERLLAEALALEAQFVESSTEGADDYRQSLVIYDAEKLAPTFLAHVRALIPEVCRRLAVPPLPPNARMELQLTAHNDGHFYKVHTDNDSLDAAAREVSFIYYFHRRPRCFSGGDLVVYEREGHYGLKLGPGRPERIDPTDNSIVFFRSARLHEVLPIHCASRAFADSRFTLNGWVWR